MLPSHGNCLAVFLLTRAAQLRKSTTIEEWVLVARRQSTFMASALGLRDVAQLMTQIGLVKIRGLVIPAGALAGLGEQADRVTLMRIAQLLFEQCPPVWLESVSTQTGIAIEYIPTQAFQALQWLGDDLVGLLREAGLKIHSRKDHELRKRLGDAAELVLIASKRTRGEQPIHVARISDSFGYDIESRGPRGTERIEVKAAVTQTGGSFFISRNEYEKSILYGQQWFVVQVVFFPSVLIKNRVTLADIQRVKALSAQDLQSLIPADTKNFAWAESGKVCVPEHLWSSYPIYLQSEVETEVCTAASNDPYVCGKLFPAHSA